MTEKKFSRAETRARAREKLQKSMARLEEGVVALVESDRWKQYLRIQARFHNYSFFNTMLILLQKPDATRVAGYIAWNKLGRQVRAGERGIAILVPYISKAKNKTRIESDLPDIRPADDDPMAEKQNHATKSVQHFGVGYVYDLSQTEGRELPEVCGLLKGQDRLALSARLDQIIQMHGFEVAVVWRNALDGANGLCNYRAKRILIASGLSPRQAVKTRIHELAHAMMHAEEEYRVHGDQSVIELEAESVAFVVLSHFGIDSSDYSFGYLATWQNGNKDGIAQTLKRSGKRIQNAAEDIISQMEGLASNLPDDVASHVTEASGSAIT